MNRPWIIAHRGASALRPENTLEAIRLADDLRADLSEIDVHLTADGVPVVMHDETVDRTTDGTGRIAELDLPAWRALRSSGCAVPTLAEVVELIAAGRQGLVIELKAKDRPEELVERCAAVVEAAGLVDRTWFWSFQPRHLQLLAERLPAARRGFLSVTLPRPEEAALGHMLVPLAAHLTTLLPRLPSGYTQPMIAWIVDQKPLARRLAKAGLAGLITNRVDHIRPLFEGDPPPWPG